MLTHRIRRGLKARIPLDADSVLTATLNGARIDDNYNAEVKAFVLNYEDTEPLEPGTLSVSYTRGGQNLTTTIDIEVI